MAIHLLTRILFLLVIFHCSIETTSVKSPEKKTSPSIDRSLVLQFISQLCQRQIQYSPSSTTKLCALHHQQLLKTNADETKREKRIGWTISV